MKCPNASFKWKWAALSLLFFAVQVFAADETTGIIYLKDRTMTVTAPKGWVLDDESGRPQGLQAVFYPAGTTWASADTVMYVNNISRTTEPTMDALIADDAERQQAVSPGLQIRRLEPIRLADGSSARVNQISGDKWGNFESIAYIDTPADYVAIVLSAKNEAAHRGAQAAFAELVKSYRLGPVEAQPR